MNNSKHRAVITAFLWLVFVSTGFSQPTSGDSILLSKGLLVLIVVLLIGFILLIAEKLLQIQAMSSGENDISQYSIFPQISKWFEAKSPEYTAGLPIHKLKEGHDLPLAGAPSEIFVSNPVSRFAIHATDFRGIAPIPKILVEIGNEVKAGDPLFIDKNLPEIQFVSPVSGEILEINRGEKRALDSIVILADKDIKYKELPAFDLGHATREQIVKYMCDGGVWPMIKERPFGTIASLSKMPQGIFISTFDTAPLAPDNNLIVRGKAAEFQKGLDVLSKLSDGLIYLGLNANTKQAPNVSFTNAQNVKLHYFTGKHPVGNAGIQMHHISALKKGNTAWTLGVQEVISIGALFLHHKYDASRTVALTGNGLHTNNYIQTISGAAVGDLLKGHTKPNVRLISGDVLSGRQISEKGFLRYFDDQITVIPEGNSETLFGWLVPRFQPSVSPVFPVIGDMKLEADTNTNGEPRALVMTGQYERLLPMNILPQQLIKAIITKDIDRMEGLGIQELAEEDIALCEFACTSKQPLQAILREGLDMIKAES